MINEIIFFLNILVISFFTLIALKLGKEALVTLISVQWVLANLFLIKQITIFGLNATSSDALVVGSTIGLNLLNEFYNKQIAQKAILIGFSISIFYAIVAILQISYTPSISDFMHEHFYFILKPVPRIVLASMFSYVFSQELNWSIYSLLKKYAEHTPMCIRNYFSIAVSQLLDTILFAFLALYGLVENITEIIIVGYGIKLTVTAFSVPIASLSKYIQKAEDV